ncbi:hypothetical protein [Methylorubrum aminovorans]|uniref:hypothetical protein n=1 Tax=Methylorubrum aminovorans TaxID=269069 RepID=UPI003C2FA200
MTEDTPPMGTAARNLAQETVLRAILQYLEASKAGSAKQVRDIALHMLSEVKPDTDLEAGMIRRAQAGVQDIAK